MIFKSFVLIFVLALALSELSVVLGKYHVYIFNDIVNDTGTGTPLTIHCKSEDDDLGEQLLPPVGHFTWKFNLNLLGNTLFYCNFQFDNMQGHYNIFEATRDGHRCYLKCLWLVRQDGLYFSNGDKKTLELQYVWPK
ncbi:hypothetical protein HHK36_020412 [Tetracentron sinense]|uniref:S-protein homolog n=1 Tax=Tetracentron sinense TaxID=13715 RepID=A0A834YU06_TETSI|nr:hypothetical protein HHK36_020412 [Tetracentron sinense]